jgi:hypothetical protein
MSGRLPELLLALTMGRRSLWRPPLLFRANRAPGRQLALQAEKNDYHGEKLE